MWKSFKLNTQKVPIRQISSTESTRDHTLKNLEKKVDKQITKVKL